MTAYVRYYTLAWLRTGQGRRHWRRRQQRIRRDTARWKRQRWTAEELHEAEIRARQLAKDLGWDEARGDLDDLP